MRRGRWEGARRSSWQPHTHCAHRAAAGERLWPHARQERGRAGAQASPKPGRGHEHRRPHVVGVPAGPLLLLAAPRGATSPARPPATPARTHPFLCGNVEVVQGHMAGGGQQLQIRGRGERAQWPLWLQEDGGRRTCKFWQGGYLLHRRVQPPQHRQVHLHRSGLVHDGARPRLLRHECGSRCRWWGGLMGSRS